MFSKDANQEVDFLILIHWLLMSLCAGIMNAVAFIGLGTFASHVTGFATLFGVHAASFRMGNALAALAVPLFFLIGAVISGLCIESRVRRGKTPHYDYVMYGCSILLILAGVIGELRDLEVAQTYLHLKKNFILLSLICSASGLLNAALSASSHSTLRITHLTGITTDLGRGIAEIFASRGDFKVKTDKTLKLNLLRGLTIVFFAFGSLVGAFLFNSLAFGALLIPALYFAYAGHHGRKTNVTDFPKAELHRSLPRK